MTKDGFGKKRVFGKGYCMIWVWPPCHRMQSWQMKVLRWELLLKIDVWKLKCPFEVDAFKGIC